MAGSGQDQQPQSQINLHTEPPALIPSGTSQQPDVRADVPPNILTAGREPALLFPFSHPTPRFQRGFQTRAILGSVPCPCLPSASPSPQAKPERVRRACLSPINPHTTQTSPLGPLTQIHTRSCGPACIQTQLACAPNGRHKHPGNILSWGALRAGEAEDTIWVLGGSQAHVVDTLPSTPRPDEASLETFTKAHPLTELLLYTPVPISSLNPFYNPSGETLSSPI